MTPLKLAKQALAAGIAVAALSPSLSYAVPLVIDEFDTNAGGQLIQITGGSAGTTISSYAPAAGALGGTRELAGKIVAVNPGGSVLQATVNYVGISPGAFALNSSINVTVRASLSYDANGAGLNQDLTPYGGLFLGGVDNDQVTEYTIRLTTFGGAQSSASVVEPALFSGNIAFPWAAFSGGANFLDIDQIELVIDAARAGDVRIESFLAPDRFNNDVPDGGETWSLIALASLGCWGARRSLRR